MPDKERDEARERVKGWMDDPKHYEPDDPRDEQTREDEIDPEDVE